MAHATSKTTPSLSEYLPGLFWRRPPVHRSLFGYQDTHSTPLVCRRLIQFRHRCASHVNDCPCHRYDGGCPNQLRYLKFPISQWGRKLRLGNASDAAVLLFYAPLFEFVDANLAAGNSILVGRSRRATRTHCACILCLL